jgi:hypothetical protein
MLAKKLELSLTYLFDFIISHPGFEALGYSVPAVHPEDSLFFPQKSGLQMPFPL